jgi:hypothetical protein
MSAADLQRALDRAREALPALPSLPSLGAALSKLPGAGALPPALEELAAKIPSSTAIAAAVVTVVTDYRRETVACASGLGLVLSCCVVLAGPTSPSSGTDDAGPAAAAAAAAAVAAAAEAAEQQKVARRQRRQQEASTRARQLKLEAQAARAAARELTQLASEDERQLATASKSTVAQCGSGGFDGSPTKGLRFAPSALCGTHASCPCAHMPVCMPVRPPSSQLAGSAYTHNLSNPRSPAQTCATLR